MVVLAFLTAVDVFAQASQPSPVSDPIRVACVGDSITYGMRVSNRKANCYPAVLGRMMGARYEVRNFGVSGATVSRQGDLPYWDCPAFEAVSAFAPHIVVLMLGTNDSGLREQEELDDFSRDYRNMIDHFTGLATPPRVFICVPPPIFGILRHNDRSGLENNIIPRIRQAAAAKNLPVIDVHAALQNRRDLFPDGLHPNAAGAAIIAETVYKSLAASGE
ncbi:MAG: GDSL-type esterase/lipase family protein [Pseudomonadota bacterium]